MRDRYNLNLLPGMSEDGLEYGELQRTWAHVRRGLRILTWGLCVPDDVDLNSVASIPGMGIPDQLKAAMEQEQSSRSTLQPPGFGFLWVQRTSVFVLKSLLASD